MRFWQVQKTFQPCFLIRWGHWRLSERVKKTVVLSAIRLFCKRCDNSSRFELVIKISSRYTWHQLPQLLPTWWWLFVENVGAIFKTKARRLDWNDPECLLTVRSLFESSFTFTVVDPWPNNLGRANTVRPQSLANKPTGTVKALGIYIWSSIGTSEEEVSTNWSVFWASYTQETIH